MDWAFEGCIFVLEGSNRVCRRVRQAVDYERSLRTEVCVRDNPKDLLFGAGAEDLRNDVLPTEIGASVRQ